MEIKLPATRVCLLQGKPREGSCRALRLNEGRRSPP